MHRTGDVDVLCVEEATTPQPGSGEVLIRVHAAAVNPIDWKYRRGLVERALPAVLGEDVSGIVEASRADRFSPGDELFGIVTSGGYAEFAVASGDALAIKPAELSHRQAAALPVSGLTAWQALFDQGRLEPGQIVLIAGAGGGIGHLAVQLAKRAGAEVIATGSGRSRDFALGLGADHFVDYTQQQVSDVVSGVDLAIDAVGGSTTQTLVPTVREGGTLITLAYPPEPQPHAAGLKLEQLVMRPSSRQLAAIGDLAAKGDLRPEILAAFPLEEVRRAHDVSETGHVQGKIVLQVAEAA